MQLQITRTLAATRHAMWVYSDVCSAHAAMPLYTSFPGASSSNEELIAGEDAREILANRNYRTNSLKSSNENQLYVSYSIDILIYNDYLLKECTQLTSYIMELNPYSLNMSIPIDFHESFSKFQNFFLIFFQNKVQTFVLENF